jgi:hypothetical protein
MLVEIYGKATMKKMQVCEWHIRFRDGRAIANDDPRCGRPTISTNVKNIERLSSVVRSYRRKNIQNISAEICLSVESIHNIFTKT